MTPNPEEIHDEGICYIVNLYMMLLLYDAFVIKEFERVYDRACDAALRSIQGMHFIVFVHYKHAALQSKQITFQR